MPPRDFIKRLVVAKKPEVVAEQLSSSKFDYGTGILEFSDVETMAETMEIDSESTDKPFLTSQEYADEEVDVLMRKMKAYLYYPKNEDDFIRHIINYDDKYQNDLTKWTAEINAIIKEDAATKIQDDPWAKYTQ